MPDQKKLTKYVYGAKDKSGRTITGTIEAADEEVARMALEGRGMAVISIGAATQEISFINRILNRVSQRELAIFARQLSTMVGASFPLVQALRVIILQTHNQKLKGTLEEVVGDIQDEYDRLPVHAVPSGWAWVVGGGLSLARLKELSGIDLACDPPQRPPETGLRNVSDWVIGHLQQPLHGGEVVDRPGVRVMVRKVRRQKVLEAQVARSDSTAAE